MENIKVVKFNRSRKISGFNFGVGFLCQIRNGRINAATSGWAEDGEAFIYRLADGEWVGSWESNSPIADEAVARDYRAREFMRLEDDAWEAAYRGDTYAYFRDCHCGNFYDDVIAKAWSAEAPKALAYKAEKEA